MEDEDIEEKKREYYRDYYQKNKQKISEYRREFRNKNKDKIAEFARKQNIQNKKRKHEYNKMYYKKRRGVSYYQRKKDIFNYVPDINTDEEISFILEIL